MSTALSIWNQALAAANARGRVASLTEVSPEADVLSLHYSQVVEAVQSAAWWPCCKAVSRLALTAEASSPWDSSMPEPGFQYSYALPANMLRPWYIEGYGRFSLSLRASQTELHTNIEDVILHYAVRQDNVSLWSAGQVQATIHALAAAITGQLTGKQSLARTNFQIANLSLEEARAQAANDVGDQVKAAPPWLSARGYGVASPVRFFYPYGELFPDAE